jgi:hypothetical protein
VRESRKQMPPRAELKFKRGSSKKASSKSNEGSNKNRETTSGESGTRSSEDQKSRKVSFRKR